MERLSGQIERVTFHNPENGFAVLRVLVKGYREPVTVVGHAAAVHPGEALEAAGRWTQDRQHGRQFQADEIRTVAPSSLEGIERYLSSGMIRGIGPHFARQIVKMFGPKVFETIDRAPSLLLDIRGIGSGRLRKIQQSWHDQKVVRAIMVFLQSHGVGTARAVRIYKTYGPNAVETVRANPYRLAADIRGIGFKTADALAQRLGIARDSPDRARAGVRHVLGELTAEGHVACPETELIDRAAEALDVPGSLIGEAIDAEVGQGRLIRDRVGDAPAEVWIYLAGLYHAEVAIARRLVELGRGRHPLAGLEPGTIVAEAERTMGFDLAPAQRDAVARAAAHKVVVITGGPGVGKTTIVRAVIQGFTGRRLRAVLCAPTGRAAKRLSETTGRDARTIHRLLEFDPAGGGFLRGPERPVEADLVVVDEASMVDTPLMAHLLRALPDRACLVLVGDVDQLPSVGPGTVLADVIRSGVVPAVRLREIFRQAQSSRIVTAAHSVNRGELPDLARPDDLTDFYFIGADAPDLVLDRMLRIITERIPQRFGLDPIRDVQVLTPMNRGLLGARSLNAALQEALNPAGPARAQVERYGSTFRVGDKVIQTENDYDKEVFNGDIGRVAAIDAVDQEVIVEFPGSEGRGVEGSARPPSSAATRRVAYDFGELDELALAYAITIHRSQGSEYPAIVVPVHTQHFVMLQRNLLYTAITRGRSLVALVGTRRALHLAVNRAGAVRRYTDLARRLQQASGERPGPPA